MSPDIALFHILPRLPAKSVSRFKCVSKEWHSFITTPRFPKMHLHNQNQQKLLFLQHNYGPCNFFTIDCETPEDGCSATRPIPFHVRFGDSVLIATSLHGMVCVLLTDPSLVFPKYCDILLWNPVTGDHKTSSKAGYDKYRYETIKHRYGMYYSSSEDDYKVVCLTDHHPIKAYIYSLKSDSWRMVESTGWCSNHHSVLRERSVLLNEKLYFANSYSVTTFDTQTEKVRDIGTPYFGNQRARCMGLLVIGNCIHFLLVIKNSEDRYDRIGEWRMDGDGDWSKVETSFSGEKLYRSDETLHLMRNGNWLMYCSREKHVYVLDAKKHTKQIMCSIRIWFLPEGRFTETFVFPNQYLM